MIRQRIIPRYSSSMEESLINLTPLIDVVFVVLIAFILIAPLLEVDHVGLAPSTKSSEKDISSKSTIAIYVREDNSIWINQRPVSLDDMLFQLKQRKKLYPHQIPQLFHDKTASFGTYQSIKNVVETAGFDKIDVILQGKGS